jgi:uncharacterized protein (TIGR00369 family)
VTDVEPTGGTAGDDPTAGPDGENPRPRFDRRAPGVAAYLGMAVSELSDGSSPMAVLRGPFAAPAHVVDAEGRTPTGILAALVDSISGMASGIAALPGWIVTTNLNVRRAPAYLFGPTGTGPLVLDTEVLRRGGSAIVTRTSVTAADDGTAVATGWMTAAVLAPNGGPPEIARPVRPMGFERVDDPTFAAGPDTFFALRDGRAPGEVALDLVDRTRNPWGILHGGAMTVLADTAARSAVAGTPALTPTPGLAVADLNVHYLSPGRVGPVRATARVIGAKGLEHLVRVSVVDHGAGDRPLVVALATVRQGSADAATVR